MANAFTLFGELVAKTSQFESAMDSSESRLKFINKAFDVTEQKAANVFKNAGKYDKAAGAAIRDIKRMESARAKMNASVTQLEAKHADQRTKLNQKSFQQQTRDWLASQKQINSPTRRVGGQVRSLASEAAGAVGLGAAVYGGVNLIQAAIEKTIEQSRANRLLAASATEAGLKQSALFAENKRFASLTGVSNVDAAGTTAKIAQLATFSGDSSIGKIQQLSNAFADLGAARGIAGDDLQNLMGSILSGQDEGLNRLGLSDPGKIYEAYAKSIGTTSDKLTQMQKVQSVVNAVVEKAGTFSGAAESRMNSLEGTIAKNAAAWANLTTALSVNFSTSGPVTDFISTASSLLGQLSIDIDKVNAKLAAGKTPEQIAEEIYPSASAGDYVSAGGSTLAFGIGGYGIGGIAARLAGFSGDEISDSQSPAAIQKRRKQALIDQIRAQQEANKAQETAAGAQASPSATFNERFAAVHAAFLKEQQKTTEANLTQGLSNAKTILSSGYTVQEAQLKQHLETSRSSEIESIKSTTALKNKELQDRLRVESQYYNALISNAATPQDAAKFANDRDVSAITTQNEIKANAIDAQTQIIAKMRETKDSIRDIFNGLAGENNPFVKIFADGAAEIERINELTKGLGGNARQVLTQMTQDKMQTAIFSQGLDNKIQAYDLRGTARQFRAGQLDADTPENKLKTFSDQLNIFQNEKGKFLGYGEKVLSGVAGGSLGAGLITTYGAKYAALTDAQKSVRDQKILDLAKNVDPRTLSKDQREAVASAAEREALRLDKAAENAEKEAAKREKLLQDLTAAIQSGTIVHVLDDSNGRAAIEQRPSGASTSSYYGSR